jgi:hypothetical protein
MSKITVRDVHVDAVLTNFAIGYHPFGMVAENIIKPMKVNKESDKYYVWDRPSAFRVKSDGLMSLRADKTEAKVVDFGLSTSTYQAEEYALKILISDREKDNSDSVLKLRESKLRRLQDLLMLEQEIRVSTLLTTSANWDSGHYDTPDVKWDAGSSVVIEKNIDDAKEVVRKAIGVEPNTIIIPAAVAKVMKRDSTIRDLVKYTHADLLVNGDLPRRLFNMNVVIPGAVYTATAEGATSITYVDVWSDYVVLLYLPSETTMDSPDSVKIFRSKEWEVRSWRVEEKRSEAIEVSVIQDEVLASNISGYLLTDVLS